MDVPRPSGEVMRLLEAGQTVALRPGERVRVPSSGEVSVFWGAGGVSLDWGALGGGQGGVLDGHALHGVLCLSHVPTPWTLDPRVKQIPAGCELVMGAEERGGGGVEVRRWHRWEEASGLVEDEGEAQRTLGELLREAVVRTLEEDFVGGLGKVGEVREVGVALSGGLDSSLVAALLVEAGCRVRLFTLDFGEPYNEELVYARQVAAHLGCGLRVVRAKGRDIDRALEGAAAALSQPFGDGVVVPWYLLASAMRAEGIDVMWTGEFGDQVFGGWANKPMIAALLYDQDGEQEEARLRTYLGTYHRFLDQAGMLYSPDAKRILEAQGVLGGEAAWVRWALQAPRLPHLLHRLRAANFWLKGAQNIAPRVAQIGRALGMRVRSPLMDGALAAWSFGLEPGLLLRGACEKYLLKRAAAPLLPDAVVWREKRGMGAPLTAWCRSPGWLWWRLRRMLSGRNIRSGGLFSWPYVKALRRAEPWTFDPQRTRRLGERLWLLLMLSTWARVHNTPLTLDALRAWAAAPPYPITTLPRDFDYEVRQMWA